ncbi:MAG: hypothetical protein KBC95_04500 [Candidatus Peribacteraceae bacterium]|nr:hypothetical protein [Candidatus Peribacteraceae bacterium]
MATGKRDLNDQHRDGDLDLDTIEPLPTPDLDLPTAEDLLLATLCQAPKYLEHTRIADVHLSPRARVIVAIIRRAVAEGYAQVDKAYLTGPAASRRTALRNVDGEPRASCLDGTPTRECP